MKNGNLAPRTRDILIDHLDGQLVRYRLSKNATKAQRAEHFAKIGIVGTLRRLGYLDRARSGYTVITEAGRDALATLLADYAEALLRVGMVQAPTISAFRDDSLSSCEELPVPEEVPEDALKTA